MYSITLPSSATIPSLTSWAADDSGSLWSNIKSPVSLGENASATLRSKVTGTKSYLSLIALPRYTTICSGKLLNVSSVINLISSCNLSTSIVFHCGTPNSSIK